MTIIDIAKNIDKSKKNEDSIDIENIAIQLNLDFYGYAEQDRLKSYWVGNWRCTDRWVGYRIYFLDDEPVAFSIQKYRKSDETIKWFSKEIAIKVRNYILSLIQEEELEFDLCDSNEDIGDSYNIEFTAQIINKDLAMYQGEPIVITERIKETPNYAIDTKLKIKLPNLEERIVDIKDLDFKFNLKIKKEED